ncbi:MAG: D-alanine--D-alanine ligase family protein [Candidatus Sungbacteria bacterium]|nr:D-alanine--D-alanine ligase family protein [bacterium]MDZ4285468.1 D-alanine--D-alanine ligase family protein [Candidatus Sungbacteria bacterium]
MKKQIAVIFGGKSVEHDVSIITAHIPIIQSLEASGQFDVWPIYIAKDGSWYSDKAMNDLDYFKRSDIDLLLGKQKKIHLLFDNGLHIIWPGLRSKTVIIDVVFPAMHGTFGEDGSLMGLLRMAGVPFVGCDLAASAIAMDKVLTKQVVSTQGIPVVPYIWFTAADWETSKEELIRQAHTLKWPIFVKPVHLGSSIGMAKVKEKSKLEQAIEVALHYDDKVLIEESIENLTEVTLPIMGNDELILGEIERPLNKTDFFNFDDKYMSGGKKGSGVNAQYSEIPANIPQDLARQIKEMGAKIYRMVGCSGMARIDFLIDNDTQTIYANEINTLPGSLYHHNWRKAGVSNIELVTTLIRLAEERFIARQSKIHTFRSDILKKSFGPKSQG